MIRSGNSMRFTRNEIEELGEVGLDMANVNGQETFEVDRTLVIVNRRNAKDPSVPL